MEKRRSTETFSASQLYTSAEQTEISKRPVQAVRKYSLVTFFLNQMEYSTHYASVTKMESLGIYKLHIRSTF